MNTWMLSLSTLAAFAVAVSAGEISGKISLKGTPPPEASLGIDPFCSKERGAPTIKSRHFVVDGGGLADVFITLKGLSGKSTGASAAAQIIDQVKCEYTPYMSAVQTGQKITVKNSDNTLHNVHPVPVVAGNKEENKAQLAKGPDLHFTFANAETFLRFKCDVHPWMFAYVSVVDHPYFAVSGKDGSFKIANVPAGKYTVVIEHRKAGKVEKEIEVKDSAKLDHTFEVK